MPMKKHKPEQIVALLRQIEVGCAISSSIFNLLRTHFFDAKRASLGIGSLGLQLPCHELYPR